MDLAFSPDGTLLASTSGYTSYEMAANSGYEDRVRIWDITTRTEKARYQMEQGYMWSTPYKLEFSYDGRYLGLVGDSKSFCSHTAEPSSSIIDLETGTQTTEDYVYSLDFYTTQNFLVQQFGGDRDFAIEVYDADADMALADLAQMPTSQLRGFTEAVFTSNDTQIITIEGHDYDTRFQRSGRICIWEANNWELVATLGEGLSVPYQITINPQRTRFATLHVDQSIHVWDIQTQKEIAVLTDFNGNLRTLAINSTSDFVLSASHIGVHRWDITDTQPVTEISHEESWNVVISADDSQIMFDRFHFISFNENGYALYNFEIVTWASVNQTIEPFFVPEDPFSLYYSRLVMNSEQSIVVLITADELPAIYDLTTQDHIFTITPDKSIVFEDNVPTSAINLDYTGRYLALAWDKVIIWNVETETAIRLQSNIYPYRDFFSSLDFSPNRQYLAAGAGTSHCWNGYDARLAIWDITVNEPILSSDIGLVDITDVAFTPDSQLLAYALGDSTIRFLETEYWREVGIVTLDTGYAVDIEFTPDGKRLVAGDSGGTIQIFGVEE